VQDSHATPLQRSAGMWSPSPREWLRILSSSCVARLGENALKQRLRMWFLPWTSMLRSRYGVRPYTVSPPNTSQRLCSWYLSGPRLQRVGKAVGGSQRIVVYGSALRRRDHSDSRLAILVLPGCKVRVALELFSTSVSSNPQHHEKISRSSYSFSDSYTSPKRASLQR